MTPTLAFLPQQIRLKERGWEIHALSVIFGVLFLALLAQVAIPLPFTPVPITGQTFGIALLSLLWGRKHGLAAVIGYLSLGVLGLPILASGSQFSFGPTSGYLFGMVVASYCVGGLADLGWSKRWTTAFAACVLGSILVFVFGLLWLSLFVPTTELLALGLLPFLPGDFLKSTLAASIAVRVNGRQKD